MIARDSRQTALRLPILSVRALKLFLAMIAGVMWGGIYCIGSGGAAAPALE